MKLRTFAGFVAPSVLAMVLMIAMPLVVIVYLAVHQSRVQTELREVTVSVPVFGGLVREDTRMVPQAVMDADGNPVRVWEYVGAENLGNAADIEGLVEAIQIDETVSGPRDFIDKLYREISDVDFWSALEFTLLYTFVTTPAILILGLALALAVNRMTPALRGTAVFITLLPMIVTPIVSSLAVYWLFIDGGVITALMEGAGLGRFYFLADKFTIRLVIILYGIWYATPFAFIILYAGLQTVPKDPLEAAIVDGASPWERVRYVVIPHLAPLMAVITLIHVMDSYRVFEPIFVFGSRVFANSVQYLTYHTLVFEDNVHKAAAYAILTVIGVVILLIPVMIRTYRDQKSGR